MSNTLSWQNVNYESKVHHKYTVKWDPFRIIKETNVRKILNNVSGQIRTGEMVAIIGASGAGKTSLMAALSSRIRGKIRGSFFVNQLPARKNMISSVTGFVPQYDTGTAVGVLTVVEHLHFVAELKLGRSMDMCEKKSRVASAIERLGMAHLKHSRIKNLSGGERKKLNLAEELLREPLFLFCDEPTTGLDSWSSKSVMQSLNVLTGHSEEDDSAKRAVICSIHQPSSEVFAYFSHIILMDSGSIVYHGNISECYVHLDKIGLSLPINYNPAEFFVKLVSPVPMNGIEHEDRIERMMTMNKKNWELDRVRTDKPKLSTSDIEEVEHLTWLSQIAVLLKRATIVGFRDIGDSIVSSSSHIIIAIGIGILYAGKAANPQAMISDVEGMLFNVLAEIFFYTYKRVILVTNPELPVVRKETGENLYHISSYYIMRFTSLLPKIIIESILTAIFMYYLSSFARDFNTFLGITISFIFLGIASASYGFMWGSMFSNGWGGEIAMPFDMYQLLIGGIYLNIASLPPFFKHFSLFYYFTEAVTYQYWIGVDTIDCVPDRNLPCLQNGLEVLDKYSFGKEDDTVIVDYACVLGWCCLFHIVGYLALRRVVNKEGFY